MVIFRVIKTAMYAIRAIFPLFIQRNKSNLYVIQRFLAVLRKFNNPIDSFFTRFLRSVSLTHQFNNQMRTDCSDNFFTMSGSGSSRSEEHTSELQSREKIVCRLLLEKKK